MLRSMNFTRYNAFCGPSGAGQGNPAAIVPLQEGRTYSDDELKAVSQDMLCEVGFILNSNSYKSSGVLRMRFFTAAQKEQKFIGHVSIAAIASLPQAGDCSLIIRSQGGDIPATRVGKCISIEISAPTHMHDLPLHRDLLQSALGGFSMDPRIPIPVYVYGTSSRLIVFVSNLDDVRPNIDKIVDASNEARVSGIFAVEVSSDGSSTRSRMFCPLIGVPEDACSGNAHGLLGFVLLHKGLIPASKQFFGAQGASVGRPSTVKVKMNSDRNTAEVGGLVSEFCSGRITGRLDMIAAESKESTGIMDMKRISNHSSDNYILGMF